MNASNKVSGSRYKSLQECTWEQKLMLIILMYLERLGCHRGFASKPHPSVEAKEFYSRPIPKKSTPPIKKCQVVDCVVCEVFLFPSLVKKETVTSSCCNNEMHRSCWVDVPACQTRSVTKSVVF